MKRKLSLLLVLAIIASAMFFDGEAVYAEAVNYENSYGEQLSTSDNSKAIYDELVEAYVYKIGDTGNKDGKYTGLAKPVSANTDKVSVEMSNITYRMSTKDKTTEQIEAERNECIQSATEEVMACLTAAFDAFTKDYPEVYWMYGMETNMTFSTFKFGTNMSVSIDYVYVNPTEYFSGADDKVSAFNEAVINAKKDVVKKYSIDETTEESQIAKAIHDYLANRLDYNYEAAANGVTGNYVYAFTAMPAFMDINACPNVVCEGYAKAYAILCNQFQIENAIITGTSADQSGSMQNHMWNAVKPEDGNWYAVDVTWDDQKDKTYYKYFLTGQKADGFYLTFEKDHIPSNTFSSYTYSKNFVLPEISDNRYMDEIQAVEVTTTQPSKQDNVTVTNKITVTASNKVTVTTTNKNVNVEVTDNSVAKKQKVTKISITKARFSKIKTQKLKDGKACKPKVKVTYNGRKLKKNKDYTITYKNNKKKGTGKVIIKGKGKFKGKKVIRFRIK